MPIQTASRTVGGTQLATVDCQVFSASKDSSKTSVKLAHAKFGKQTVWLNLRTIEDKPDFGAQRIVAEILRGLVGSGTHRRLTIDTEADIVISEKGELQVKMTKEDLKSRWTLVENAPRDESVSDEVARAFFADDLPKVQSVVSADDQPF